MVSVLGMVICLVGRSGALLVGRIRSGDRSHGLFSWQMRLAGSSLSLVFCLGRMPCLVLEPWIGFVGPVEGPGASLRISLMLCNYIKFQNCKYSGWRFNDHAITWILKIISVWFWDSISE